MNDDKTTTAATTNAKAIRDRMPTARAAPHRGKTTTVTAETFALMTDEASAAGISHAELADLAGVSRNLVARMAKGLAVRPTPDRALAVIECVREHVSDDALERLGIDRPTQYDDPALHAAAENPRPDRNRR